MDSKTFTYQARIALDKPTEAYLNDAACLLSKVERHLFAVYSNGGNILKAKNEFLVKFGITARQFNACRIQLQGRIDSIKALRDGIYIPDQQTRVNKTEACIKALSKLKTNTPRQKNKLHQKQRLLRSQQRKLARLQRDKENNKVRLCFGSKKLFKKQFCLDENGYSDFNEWKKDWKASRSSQFSLVGSKDETAGNQSCIAKINSDNSIDLKLRVPPVLESTHGKFFTIPNIQLNYGLREILSAIDENKQRNALQKKAQRLIHGDKFKELGQAISYRFLRDEKGWRVFITVDKKAVATLSCKQSGRIGVDINEHHLAVTETDRTGNPVNAFNIPLVTYGKSSNQAKAIVGDASKQLVEYALSVKKPIVLEKLDFQKKKLELDKNNSKHSRMLNSFAYTLIIQTISSRAFRFGVEVYQVNPAYTSVIGRVKFAKNYGISIHNAAALVIARRHQGFSETVPRSLDNIPNGQGDYGTLFGLVKIRGRHVWSSWAKVLKAIKTAHVVHNQRSRQSRNCYFVLTGKRPALTANLLPF